MKDEFQQFGPWTTGLHCGSRMELSAFWRRRLERLGSLAGGGRRLGRSAALVLGIFSGGLLLVPQLRWAQAAEAQVVEAQPAPAALRASEQPAAAKAAAADEKPFTATFSNGVQVQLVGLSLNPSQGQPCWSPDGSPLAAAPYASMHAKLNPGADGVAREICWRWLELPEDPDFETKWAIDPMPRSSGGGPFDANVKPVEGLSGAAVGLPGTPTKCTVRFQVSVGNTPWTTAFNASGGSFSSSSRGVNGVQQAAFFGERVAADGGTAVTVSYQLPNVSVRLAAIDKDGAVHTATSKNGGSINGLTQMSYRFTKLPPTEIARLELQTQVRQYETIEFRDVSLQPDVPSDVRVFRIGPDGKAERIPVKGAPAPAAEKATQPAAAKDAEERFSRSQSLLKTLADEHGYRLEEGQPVKHIPPPFVAARNDYWKTFHDMSRSSGLLKTARQEEVVESGFLLLRWSDGELQPFSTHLGKTTLQRVLDAVFQLRLQQVEGDASLLAAELPGDWVISWDPGKVHRTNEAEVAVLERRLQEQLLEAVHLELREVQRPVYVMKGNYKFTAVPGPNGKIQPLTGNVAEHADGTFQIPARRTEVSLQAGSFERFLDALGQVLLTPIVDESTVKPKKDGYFWGVSGKQPEDIMKPFDSKTVDEVLASVSLQTGYTFVKEERPVKMLFLKRGVRE